MTHQCGGVRRQVDSLRQLFGQQCCLIEAPLPPTLRVERDRHDDITLRRMRQPIVCHQVPQRLGQGCYSVVLESMYGFADCPFEVEYSADAWNLKSHGATSKAEPGGWSIYTASTSKTKGRLNAWGLADALLAEPRAQFVAADAAWRVEEVKNGGPNVVNCRERQRSHVLVGWADPMVSRRPYRRSRHPSS